MSASVITRTAPAAAEPPPAPFDRSRIPQYSLAKVLGVWAAAVPMGVLAWVVAPLLSDQLGGREGTLPRTRGVSGRGDWVANGAL